MKVLILLSCIVLGFMFGRTYEIKLGIERSSQCFPETLTIDLKKFFNEKIAMENLYIHAQAAVALKYESCMWSKK